MFNSRTFVLIRSKSTVLMRGKPRSSPYTNVRLNSNVSQSSGSAGSYLAAGAAGGAVAALAGYGWYRFSGVKKTVDSAHATQEYIYQAKDAIVQHAPKSPNEALTWMRDVTKAYAALIPGASKALDDSFEALEHVVDTHHDEMNQILTDTHKEIQQILSGKNLGSVFDVSTGVKIADILQNRLAQLSALTQKAGQDGFSKLAEKNPRVSSALGAGYEQLRQIAENGGPDAKKILDDTTKQITDLFSQGFSTDQLNKGRELIEAKTHDIEELVKKSSREAWKKAVEQAAPYLDKVPELKQTLDDNADKFIAAGGAIASGQSEHVKAVITRLKEAGEDLVKDNKKVKELKEFVVKAAQEAEEAASQGKGDAQARDHKNGNQDTKKSRGTEQDQDVDQNKGRSGKK